MKKSLIILFLSLLITIPVNAVLKEKDLNSTLSILRTELTKEREELQRQSELMKQQQEDVLNDLMDIISRSNQNSLMLYSQKPGYIFDLTYACHEATEQYNEFQENVLPFTSFIERNETEIARYDSLVTNLSKMMPSTLDEKARIDRNVCLTLAVNIRRTLKEYTEQFTDYVRYYKNTESRLAYLNDYANQRYYDIQTSIFRNGGENYFNILKNLGKQLKNTTEVVTDKYKHVERNHSQWDSRVMLFLYTMIIIYGFISFVLNILVVRFLLPKRLNTEGFKIRRTCIIQTTSVITLAIILGAIRMIFKDQYFLIMASGLLVEYAWLLSVILISLLIRLEGTQIKSGFHIYSPLMFIGFVVITFRIVLIPNDLVDLIFPPILLCCALWQWRVIKKHNKNIPNSDVFYSYTTLFVFIVSVGCSWLGYTLLSVQILIWWIMQLTCILTITCIQGLLKQWALRHGYEEKPITQSWFYRFVYDVCLPLLAVISIMISIYWAADVFNLGGTSRRLFSYQVIDAKGFKLSAMSIAQVIALFLIFRYIANTLKLLARQHFDEVDPSSAPSRIAMASNIINLVVWGAWLLISLAILHVSSTWLVVISGGLSTGIGFAMKDIIENIYYGVALMAGRVKVGDWIVLDGTRGRVSSISYTSTMIEATDGAVIAFQNSQLFTKNYKNMTKNHGYEQDIFEVGVAYGTDVEKVRTLLQEKLMNLDCVYKRRPVNVVVKEFGDNSVNLKVMAWIPVRTQYVDDGRLKECVYNTLRENGIEIPFPQRDIHIIK